MRHQPQLRDLRGRRLSREKESSRVPPDVEAAVAATARRFRCSKSWVQAVALGEFFGIDVTRFDEPERKNGHRRK